MNPTIVSSISRLANYMPLGSYVIYTALETYSFSLGTAPSPITTIIQTPTYNYTCLYIPGGNFTYTSCTADQSNALCISLSIGFFLAVFLSFLKHVPIGGSPPLAGEDGDDGDDGPGDGDSTTVVDDATQTTTVQLQLQPQGQQAQVVRVKVGGKHKKVKYRSGVIYAQGNYYLDFGDYHVWGHALLSFVAFGTLSLFSSSVSQCLFPKVKPWIFVFTQIILLVICAFIAMFWIDDPSLSIGLMVAPPTESHGTQTAGGAVSRVNVSGADVGGLRPGQFAAAATNNVATSTASAFPTMNLAQFNSSATTGAGTGTTTPNMFNNKNISSSSVFSASTAVSGSTNTCNCNNHSNNNGYNTTTTSSTGPTTAGTNRLGGLSKRVSTMSSVNEKQGDEEVHELGDGRSSPTPSTPPTAATTTGGRTTTSQEWNRGDGGPASALVQGIMIASSLDSSSSPPPLPGSNSPSSSPTDHVSVKMD